MSKLMKLKVRHRHCGKVYSAGQMIALSEEFAEAMENNGKAVGAEVSDIVKAKVAARAAKAEHDEKKQSKADVEQGVRDVMAAAAKDARKGRK